MTDIHPALPHLDLDHPLFFAWFTSRNAAELGLSSAIAAGVDEQDFTLIEPGPRAAQTESLGFAVAPFSEGRDPAHAILEAGHGIESPIGAGIATSDPDDDVSGPEEMDDSQSASEGYLTPASGHYYGDEDARDMRVAARTGFAETTLPEVDDVRPAEAPLTEIDLPGLGTVLGEGAFGTALLEARYRGGVEAVNRRLWGVSNFDGDVCVLAIDLTPNGPSPELIEQALQGPGLALVQTIG